VPGDVLAAEFYDQPPQLMRSMSRRPTRRHRPVEAGLPQTMDSDDAITGRRFYGDRTQGYVAGWPRRTISGAA
jgi:hypothetical protein